MILIQYLNCHIVCSCPCLNTFLPLLATHSLWFMWVLTDSNTFIMIFIWDLTDIAVIIITIGHVILTDVCKLSVI